MREPKLLDEQILEAPEQRWHSKGAATPEIMEAGLTDEEIDAIATPLGFPLDRFDRRGPHVLGR